jgi:hypothetical protein
MSYSNPIELLGARSMLMLLNMLLQAASARVGGRIHKESLCANFEIQA